MYLAIPDLQCVRETSQRQCHSNTYLWYGLCFTAQRFNVPIMVVELPRRSDGVSYGRRLIVLQYKSKSNCKESPERDCRPVNQIEAQSVPNCRHRVHLCLWSHLSLRKSSLANQRPVRDAPLSSTATHLIFGLLCLCI